MLREQCAAGARWPLTRPWCPSLVRPHPRSNPLLQAWFAYPPLRACILGEDPIVVSAEAACCETWEERLRLLLKLELVRLFRCMDRLDARPPHLAAADPSRFVDAAAAVLEIDMWAQVRVYERSWGDEP